MKEIIEIDSMFGKIKTFKNDLITDQILKFGNHTRPEFAFATSIISKEFNIFDLGAHIGTFTLKAIRKIDNKSKLLAVEADKDNYNILKQNTQNYQNIIQFNSFLGDINESYEFVKGSNNNSGGGSLIKISNGKNKIYSIDKLVEKFFEPDYLKIDIEGLENKLVENSNYIKDNKPILYIEINNNALKKNNSSSKEFLKLLSDHGYHFFRNIGFRNANNDLYLSCYMHNIHDFPLSNIFDVLCICKKNIIYDYLFKSSVKINKNK